MPVADSVYLEEAERDPFGVFSSPPDVALIRKHKTFLTGGNASGKLVFNGVDISLEPLKKYSLAGTELKKTDLIEGQTYRVIAEDGDIDAYVYQNGRLLKRTGEMWIDAIGVGARPAIANMIPGVIYYNNSRTGVLALGQTWELSNDGQSIIEGQIKASQYLVNPETANILYWDGYAFNDVSLPYTVSFYAEANLNLYEEDGVTPRAIPRRELLDTYAAENGNRINPAASAYVQHSVLLANQTDPTQRWCYLFISPANTPTFTWQRFQPNRSGPLTTQSGYLTVEVLRTSRQNKYRCMAVKANEPVRAFQTNPALNTEVYWRIDDPGLAERIALAKRLEAVEAATPVITEADPVALAEIERVAEEINEAIAALPPDRADEIAALTKDVEALDTTKADKTSVDDLNKAVKALNDAIALGATDEELAKAKADLSAAIAAVETSLTTAATTIDRTVIEWENKGYKSDRIVARGNAFFKCVIAHATGIDPLTDNTGHWAKFPQDGNTIGANRSPTVSDKHPEGTIWEDLSFGSTTPLRFLTSGDGVWLPLNQITLSRIRFDLYGTGSTYRSSLSGIKFFKADGTEMPNGWFVWGARSGIGGQQAGTNYTGQGMNPQYNGSGWAELEPSASYDLKESISKITGSLAYATFRSVTFIYSNGGSKNFTPSGGNLATIDPPIASRFGDSTISAQGEVLTAAKLTDPGSRDPGRVTGQEFVSAVRTIVQSSGARPEIIRSTLDPDYTQEWETWRKVTEDLTAWTITVVEYARTSEDSSMPMIVRTEPRRPPTHADATTNAQGEFVAKIPGGGEFVYTNSRNGGNNYATFPPDVYKEVASYYVDANDAVIPLTTMAQQVAPGSTALGIGAIAISTEAIAFVVEFYKLDNSKITYRVPLS